jgi:hypothetical protein
LTFSSSGFNKISPVYSGDLHSTFAKIFAEYLAATAQYKMISLPVSGLKTPHTGRIGKNVK